MINPVWQVKNEIGTADTAFGWFNDGSGDVTENVLLRLAFHDCIPYEDGSGGCDGCLNFKNMGTPSPNPNYHDQYYQFEPMNTTDKGLDRVVEKLELIYTTLDWPFAIPSLEVSLFQSGNVKELLKFIAYVCNKGNYLFCTGKSRADLWQLASLIALEQAIERANRACDLDFNTRQQVRCMIDSNVSFSILFAFR